MVDKKNTFTTDFHVMNVTILMLSLLINIQTLCIRDFRIHGSLDSWREFFELLRMQSTDMVKLLTERF